MRAMSFALTTEQVINRTKTVTRRLGWRNLKPGTVLWAVRKAMGLKPGERHERLGLIVVTDVRTEALCKIYDEPVGTAAEGFPDLNHWGFVSMFARNMRCDPSADVQRIEFRYIPGGRV